MALTLTAFSVSAITRHLISVGRVPGLWAGSLTMIRLSIIWPAILIGRVLFKIIPAKEVNITLKAPAEALAVYLLLAI